MPASKTEVYKWKAAVSSGIWKFCCSEP